MTEGSGLTPEEDAELRRLHFFARFGAVAGRMRSRYGELRTRDRRDEIREPVVDVRQVGAQETT